MATTAVSGQLAELRSVVDDLLGRVAALETSRAAPRSPRSMTDLAEVQAMLAGLEQPDGGVADGGVVRYVGAGSVAGRVLGWQMDRRWEEVTSSEPAVIAPLLAALGSAQRVQIVQLLLRGPASTATLTDQLAGRSSGQLFHHLKELLAADVIHQPGRGTYAIREQHAVPLLTLLSCALDARGATVT